MIRPRNLSPASGSPPIREQLSPDRRGSRYWFGAGIGVWLVGLGALHLLSDLSARPLMTLGLLFFGFLGLGILFRFGLVELESRTWLLGLAVVGRLMVLPLTPDLSNDVWRYLWDGKVVAAGFDPYRLAPEAVELVELRDDDGGVLWHRLHHRSVPTVYPPLALTAQSLIARLPGALWWWKALLTAVDLFSCWLLLRLADAKGLSRRRVAWYALNPLVLLEVSGMGHVDALGVAAVLLSVALLTAFRGRWVGAALAAAAGVLVKLVPIVAWPLWARTSGRKWPFLSVALVTTALALWPVLRPGIPPGLVAYAVSWEFNGPLYEPLWRAIEWSGVVPLLHWLLDQAKEATGWHEGWNRIYPWLYSRLLAKGVLACLVAGVCVRSLRRRDVVGATGELFGGLLLCVATLYPWYLLWVLPWAALARHRAWLWASGAVLLSYWSQFGGPELWPWIHLLIWVPCGLIWWMERRGRGAVWTMH